MTAHQCPQCGGWHMILDQLPQCVCGHPRSAHEDNGGRLKKAYCTWWGGGVDDPLRSWRQCDCLNYQPQGAP